MAAVTQALSVMVSTALCPGPGPRRCWKALSEQNNEGHGPTSNCSQKTPALLLGQKVTLTPLLSNNPPASPAQPSPGRGVPEGELGVGPVSHLGRCVRAGLTAVQQRHQGSSLFSQQQPETPASQPGRGRGRWSVVVSLANLLLAPTYGPLF